MAVAAIGCFDSSRCLRLDMCAYVWESDGGVDALESASTYQQQHAIQKQSDTVVITLPHLLHLYVRVHVYMSMFMAMCTYVYVCM